jgi:hypothetical protein
VNGEWDDIRKVANCLLPIAYCLFTTHYSPFTIHHSLKIVPGISFSRPDILPDISPESKYQIQNNGRAHRQEGGIHKIHPDLTGGNAHAVADSRTNSECVPFHKVFEFVHTPKLENPSNTRNR